MRLTPIPASGRLELGVERDLGIEHARHRTIRLGVGRDLVEFLGVDAGNARARLQIDGGDRPVARPRLEGDRGVGGELLRREAGAAERSRERHGEAARMGGTEQLLRVGADAVLEARRKGILRVLEDPAVGRDRALALLEIAAPSGRGGAFHGGTPVAKCRCVPGLCGIAGPARKGERRHAPKRLPCPSPPGRRLGFGRAVSAGGFTSPRLPATASTWPSWNSMSSRMPTTTAAAARSGWLSGPRTSAKPRASTP